MKTSPTEPAEPGTTLLVFLDTAGEPDGWLRLGAAVIRGDATEALPDAQRTILVVPGEEVAVHWLELDETLTQAQAAAAARLILADASAAPLTDLHVAIGRPENGRTPAGLVPAARMAAWLAAAGTAGLDPDSVLPSPFLLSPPSDFYVRRDVGAVADYRGQAAAFALEPELAEALVGEASVETIDPARFEAELASIVAAPPLDLRQGPFARRRVWRLEGGRMRRVLLLAIGLVLLTLAVQVATILGYTFAADRLQAEADALAAEAPGTGAAVGFGGSAAIMFEAVRATPNVELSQLEYRPDGSLSATVMLDDPATLSALQQRLQAAGLRVEPGEARSAGGRPTADLTVRPA